MRALPYQPLTSWHVSAALEMVEQELPVVPDMSIAHNAQILLDACQAVGLVEWSIALALALENTLVLSGTLHGGRSAPSS